MVGLLASDGGRWLVVVDNGGEDGGWRENGYGETRE